MLLVGSGSRAGHLLGDNGLVGLPGFVVVGILQKYLAPSSNGLLPNLRKLDWDAKDLKKSPYLTLLFNSGLLACHATGCDEIEDLLGSLLEVSPKLRVLELKSTVSTISIPIFQYLRTLHVMENNIPYVGLMPSLEDLRWAPRGDQLAAQLGKGIRVCFPALRKVWFHVDVTNLAHVVAFLHSIQTTSLRSFTLIATSETQSDETSLVKRLLEALPRHSKLQEFAFSLRMRASLVLPNSSHLNSLARLSELQSLFFSGIDFHVTDYCIYRLSGAWPKLRKFHIAHLNTSPQPLVTLAALQSFAIHNPHLTYLRIRLDAHPLNPFDSKAQRLDHIRIHFDYSPLSRDCTRQVAESICDIYPCAELIISAGWARTNNSPFDYTVWGEVHNLIPIISSVRYRAPVAEVRGMHDINIFLNLMLQPNIAALAEDYDAESYSIPHRYRASAEGSVSPESKLVHLLSVVATRIRFQVRYSS